MPTLTPDGIARVALGAGFKGETAVKMVAIALSESGGNTQAHNVVTDATGLWQIYWRVHIKSHPTWTRAWCEIPENNARAAYILSDGGKNLHPWDASRAAWTLHMTVARKAVNGAPAGAGAPPTPAGKPATPAAGGSFALTDGHSWLRIVEFVTGAIALLLAFSWLLKLEKLVPAGKVLKLAKAVTT